jgi:hypothetical protein
MAFGQKYIPRRIDLDSHESLVGPDAARYIKNLIYSLEDTSVEGVGQGAQTGVYKLLPSNAVYVDDFTYPAGNNHPIGSYTCKELNQAFWFTYNDQGNHSVHRINGSDQTIDVVYIGPALNFTLNPENFIHKGACWLEIVSISDPDTDEEIDRTFLFFTDGVEDQHCICVEDSIATDGFNPVEFPFFAGNYDPKILITMATPTPNDCIQVVEVPLDQDSVQLSNNRLYNTWQWRIRTYDVWGKPSEYGIYSDLDIPGGGGCIQSSTNLPRCVNLIFNAPPPHINQVEIAYRNCNVTQWYTAATLNLYSGSPLGEWWTRSRNPGTTYPFFSYDSNTGKITYTFCAEQGCDPIAPAVTSRLYNPIPRSSEALPKISQYIGLSNNKDGFLPWPQDLLNQFSINVNPPDQTQNAARSIEIFVEIFNPFLLPSQGNQPIYQSILTGTNKVYAYGSFHGINNSGVGAGTFQPYQQYFTNPNQSGFIGTLVGTGSYVVSQQYSMDTNGNMTLLTDFTTLQNPGNPNARYFQKFTFSNVAPQKYIFRITSQQTDPTVDPTYIGTSTTLRGSFQCNFSVPSTQFQQVNHSVIVSDAKELLVDVCNTNYSTLTDSKILVIYDLSGSTARSGYVKNTNQTTVSQIGIELLKVGFTSPQNICSQFTDHNGFFFVASTASGHGSQYNISGYCSCKFISFTGGIDIGSSGGLTINNWYLNDNTACPNYDDPVDGICNYILISGQVVQCGTTVGVPNVGVVLTRGAFAFTDNNGNFSIIAHDDATTAAPRVDSLYYITSSCPFTDCQGNCLQAISVTINKCISCASRTQTVSSVSVQYSFVKGLLSGGTYPVGLIPWDWAGRPGFVQPLGNAVMPSVYQTKAFAPSELEISWPATIQVPPSVAYFTFCIGQETTIANYVTWIVDSFLFVDNTGLENTEAPTQIKIYYASLVEYNKQNNYNTTVNWGFLEPLPANSAAGTTQTPYTNDRVQFLLNGDGTFFTKNIVSLVKYDQTGQYFLIQYTSDLAGLVANARIRIFRPKVCTTTAPYFETCSPVLVNNGTPEVSSIILNAFDTYYINRGLIPVPVAQDTNPVTYIDQPRLQGLPFEHNSPSDFWGLGCYNQGRSNTANPQETVIYSKDQIALSGALSPTAQLNFLCYFDNNQKFSFFDNPTNGIVSVIPYGVILLIIGQSDHFVVGFNDNVMRVDASGNVIVPSAAEQFGNPSPKNTPKYGCLYFDKNTIYEKDGLVHWMDTAKATTVQHNFSTAQQTSQQDLKRGIPGGIDSWLRPKIKEIQNFNLQNNNTRYWHSVVNTQGTELIITDFTLGNTNPVNNERQIDFTANETIAMSLYSKVWKSFYGFTPELYIELEGELAGQQLFSFVKGIPYAHYNELESQGFGQMYGQNLVRVIEPVVSIDNLRNKKPLAAAVFCKESQYFSDRVISSTGQQTRMLLGAWIQASFGWYAPFLCDLNTPVDPNRPIATGANVLMDGNTIIGTFVKVRLIGNPADDTIYSELQGCAVSVFPEVTNLENQT